MSISRRPSVILTCMTRVSWVTQRRRLLWPDTPLLREPRLGTQESAPALRHPDTEVVSRVHLKNQETKGAGAGPQVCSPAGAAAPVGVFSRGTTRISGRTSVRDPHMHDPGFLGYTKEETPLA